jgi:outer membrane lipase/esterase
MSFQSRLGRRLPLRWIVQLLSIGVLALLASCGGSRVNQFAPERVLAFGDEASVINANGTKYTINALDANNQIACGVSPIWVQYLAAVFGLPFKECPGNVSLANIRSINYSAPNAKVADVAAQIAAHRTTGPFGSKDLVTIFAGANDIREQYALIGTQGRDAVFREIQARGKLLAQEINSIANQGGKVLIVTVPNLGFTPFGRKAGDANSQLLKDMTEAFNLAMRLNVENDGTKIGLVAADFLISEITVAPSSYSFSNVSDAACLPSAALPGCTTQTLVPGANGDTWLWADDNQLSPGAHLRLGQSAEGRARNNPF